MDKEKPKIFLSYAREDMGMAKQLFNDLKRYGLYVWLDTESLLPGDRWKDRIQEAIENSNYFIALLSSRSMNKKGFVQKELKTALEVLDLFPSSERFILPLRLDDCEICERKLKEHHWVDLFPEIEYLNGLKKILQVVSPGTFLLRSEPMKLSEVDVNDMILRYGFYEGNRNPAGRGFDHKYELQKINGDDVIFDEISCLMWQQSGNLTINFSDVEKCIKKLNKNGFAGFNDWRLPTLEEAMSLVRPEEKDGLHIDHIFDRKQENILTTDLLKDENWKAIWFVDFIFGRCYWNSIPSHGNNVRAVRSAQSFEE